MARSFSIGVWTVPRSTSRSPSSRTCRLNAVRWGFALTARWAAAARSALDAAGRASTARTRIGWPAFQLGARFSSRSTPRGQTWAHIPQPTQEARVNDWFAIAYWRTSIPISQ